MSITGEKRLKISTYVKFKNKIKLKKIFQHMEAEQHAAE